MRNPLSIVRADIIRQLFTAALVLAMALTFSCSSEDNDSKNNPSDGDKGNDIANYKTKQIGNQVWMAENLNYAVEGGKCYGEGGKEIVGWEDNTPIYKTLSTAEIQANCEKYGRLYDWATAMALPSSCNSSSCSDRIGSPHRGICPSGWHIPSNADWSILENFVDGSGTKLKATSGWNSSNGTDEVGFSALPGGYTGVSEGFLAIGRVGLWWSSSEAEYDSNDAYNLDISNSDDRAHLKGYDKYFLHSVRCLRDDSVINVSSSSVASSSSGKSSSSLSSSSGKSSSSLSSSSSMSMCNGTPYNPTTQRCQNYIIETKCGTNGWYDATNANFRCQSNVLEYKCESDWYNTTTQYCKDGTTPTQYGSITYSGQTYRTVEIGNQIWMAENLNYNASGSKCYNNDNSNCAKYGRLYNWATAMANSASSNTDPSGVQGICPIGWHIPSNAEWDALMTAVGGLSTAGPKLKATSGWNFSGNGTDNYGFSALPSGSGNSNGSFGNDVGIGGTWWSASEYDSDYAYWRTVFHSYEYVSSDYGIKSYFFSVRCLQD